MTLVLPERDLTKPEVELLKATTTLRETEGRIALLNEEMEKLKLRELTAAIEHNAAANSRNRTYDYVASVSEESVEQALDTISRWHRISHDPITVRFTSAGGNPISGLVLLDALTAMREEGTPIITVALGMAASMAAVLLQAGSDGQRVIGPRARIMIHEGSMGVSGKIRDVKEQNLLVDSILSTLIEVLAERSTITKAEIRRRINKGDWWLRADDAIKFGFADRKGSK